MKARIILLLFCLLALLLSDLMAQVPQGIPYQAVARNNQALLTNQTFNVRFTILEGGNTVYQEVHSVQTNEFGLFTAIIGDGFPNVGSFANISWGTQAHNLEVAIDLGQGGGFVIMGTTPLESVPYSLFSEQAQNLAGGIGSISDVLAPAPNPGDVLKWDGSMWVSVPDGGGGGSIAGTGITISNDTIYNSGDADASDDIIIGTAAGGDLGGTYPNPEILSLQGRSIANLNPANGDVLKWTGTEWRPSPDNVTSGGGVNVTARLSGDGGIGNELDIAQQGAGIGQVLKWDGFSWTPANDEINTQQLSIAGTILTLSGGGGSVNLPFVNYIPGQGISIVGSVISNTGDADPSDDITINTAANGDVSGNYPTLSVVRLRGNSISPNPPSFEDVLKFRNGQWVPDVDETVDPDSDPTNEIQTLSRTGTSLVLSNGGGTITIPTYSAGVGIALSATQNPDITQITNTGDTNPNDDLTTSSLAGGDANGPFNNLTINAIQGNAISTAIPNTGEVLSWNGSQWTPGTNDDGDPDATNELQTLSLNGSVLSLSSGGGTVTLPDPPVYTAGPGISVNGTVISNTGDLDGLDDITIGSLAGGDLSGTYPNPTVDKIQGLSVSNTTPGIGQILKWNGTQWAPENDDDEDDDTNATNEIQSLSLTGITLGISSSNTINLPVYTAGTGISMSGSAPNTIINNTGDTNALDDITQGSAAGGDLGGTYPNPSVTQIQGSPVSNTAPTANQILKWNGTQWIPAIDDDIDDDSDPNNENQDLSIIGNTLGISAGNTVNLPIYSAGTGISLSGGAPNTIINNTGDTNGADDINIGTPATGDLGGTYPSPIVTGLQGLALSSSTPTTNQILKWNGSEWTPSTDDDTDADADPSNEIQDLSISGNTVSISSSNSIDLPIYSAGTGISLTGSAPNTTIVNSGDTDPSDDITIGTPAGGDLAGTYPNPVVGQIQGSPVSSAAPTTGQVLKWNGTQWTPSADEGVDADSDPTNEFQTLSISGNSLTITPSGNTVSLPEYTAGTAIDITGNVVTNTGDTNPADDITTSSSAGGDVDGTFSSLNVNAIQGSPVTTTPPSVSGQILKWNGTQWTLGSDVGEIYSAGTGINIATGNIIENTGDTNPADDITTSSTAGGDASGVFSSLTVTGLQGSGVSTTAPTTTGQVLKWNGTEWEPGTDEGTIYTAGTGIDISGSNVIANTGDTDASDDITTATAAAGDVSGTFPTLTVDGLNGNPVANTTPATGEVLKWNGTQWAPATDGGNTYTGGTGITVTGANVIVNDGDTDASDDITTSTASAGDVSGNFPTLTVTALNGNAVANTTPSTGEVLKWNGTQWEASTDSDNTYTAGTGIAIDGSNEISNTGDPDASDDITTSTAAAGDVSGTFPSLTVEGLNGNPVANTAPTLNQVLKWNGTQWAPSTDATDDADSDATNEIQTLSISGTTISLSDGGSSIVLPYTGGTGITVSGTSIINSGDTDASDDLTTGSIANGDLDGTYPNPTVDGLQGNPVASTAPATNEVLKWNGTQWAPASDNVLTAGTGLGISSNIISLGNTAVTSGTYGSASAVPAFTVDAQGRLTGVSEIPITDNNTTYSAGTGLDLTGTTFSIENTSVTAGSYGSGTEVPVFTVDAQGRITGVTNTTISGNIIYTAGPGIDIDGTNQITNIGDTDPSNDLTITSTAGGDATGIFSALTVTQIQGQPISSGTPGANSVLKYVGGTWTPSTDENTTYTAGTGLTLSTNEFSLANTAVTAGSYGSATEIPVFSVDAQGRITGVTNTTLTDNNTTYTAGTGLSLTGTTFNLDNTAVTAGSYGSTTEVPAITVDAQGRITNVTSTTITDNNTTYTAGTGLDLSGTVFNLANTAVSAGSYGSATEVPVLSVDAQGRITGVTNTTITDNNTTYTAGTGLDLSGTIFNLNNTAVSAGSYGSATEVPVFTVDAQGRLTGVTNTTITDNNTTYTAGTGMELAGTTFNMANTAVTAGSYGSATEVPVFTVDAQGRITGVTNTTISGGGGTTYSAGTGLDLTGTTFSLANTAVTAGTYGSTTEVPVLTVDAQGRITGVTNTTITDNNTTYTAGTGINITGGNVVENTGLLTTTNAGGDVSGTFSALKVDKIQNVDVATATPLTGEVLFYDGTNWLADTLTTTNLDVDSDIIPETDDAYDLGSTTSRFNEVFATSGIVNTSDFRAKKEIEDLDYGLEEIMKLRPVSFEWKKEGENSRKLGLIAQEILPVIGEVVKTHNTTVNPETGETQKEELDRYGVYYSDLIPVLIKGMQEQQEEISKQKDLLDKQEKMIIMLEERLSKLEKNQ